MKKKVYFAIKILRYLCTTTVPVPGPYDVPLPMLYLSMFLFQAVKDFRSALDKDEDFSRAKEGIQKAQKLEKQAKKRDYYKILGVKRTASKKEINKASAHSFCLSFLLF